MYKKFVELLQRKDVTPYKVSKETGVSQQTLSDWKNGKSIPKVDKLQKIADYFNVPIDWFTNDGIQVLPNFRIYKSVELFFIRKLAVVLQQLSYNPLHKYCIQYAGNGHYFASIEDVYTYLQKRWSSKTRIFTEIRLLELLESAPVLDIDPGKLWCKNYASNIHNSNVVQGDSVSSVMQDCDSGTVTVNTAIPESDGLTQEFMNAFNELPFDKKIKAMDYVNKLKNNPHR